MGKAERNRAIVLGASMAGLLAARVLAEQYAEVVVVDRDHLHDHHCAGDHYCPRSSVPQSYHVHALLARGRQVLEDLFPGFTAELIDAGAVAGDVTGNVRWIMNGRRMPKPSSDMLLLSMTRPMLEQRVRARVRSLPNVRFLERHDIAGLLTAADLRTIVGAAVVVDGTTREVPGDIVVDATGRRTRTPLWLRELGYPEPEEETLQIRVGYTTQYYRLPPGRLGDEISIDIVASASSPRGAICAQIEDGRALVTAYGMLGDYPPHDSAGLLAYLRSLSSLDIYEAVRDQEPLHGPVAYRFPANLRRRYERMAAFPDGLLVLGDAVCSFNPVYGQGMTVAALGALVLRDHVARPGAPSPANYFADLARRAVDQVWELTTSADLAFPQAAGVRTERMRREQEYVDRLLDAAADDSRLLTAYARVIGLVDPPEALAAPELQAAVDRAGRGAAVPTEVN